jgi:hypothetical protein
MQFVATDAAAHGCHALNARHLVHLGDFAVAHLTLHTRVEMLAVGIPGPGQCAIHAHPWNFCVGLVVPRESLNTWLTFGNTDMALHASGGSRVGHQCAGIWVCVTSLALQT